MKIVEYKFFPFFYDIALSPSRIIKKLSVVISVRTTCGLRGSGELNLLGNCSQNTFIKMMGRLENLLSSMIDKNFFLLYKNFDKTLFSIFQIQREAGEVLFALESILFDLFIKQGKLEGVSGIIDQKIRINALICDHSNDELQRLIDKGFRCFKIKIEQKNEKRILEIIDYLYSQLLDRLVLRFDGNLMYDRKDLISFLNKIPPYLFKVIEYLEDPLIDMRDKDFIFKKFNIPFALDENLPLILESQFYSPATTYWILKPSRFGLSKTLRIMKKARSLHIKIIISSSFESHYSFAVLLFLAGLNKEEYAGLDTNKYIPKELRYIHKTFNK